MGMVMVTAMVTAQDIMKKIINQKKVFLKESKYLVIK
jgi:hypothetical protein